MAGFKKVSLTALTLFTLVVFMSMPAMANGQGNAYGNGDGGGKGHKDSSSSESQTQSSTTESTPGNPNQECDGDPTGHSDTGNGANHDGPYDNTCPAGPSGNGNGGGNATGKPCAGCVGQADDKNPKGQYPDGSDHNNGYECDGNHGIGRTNPAHTGCKSSPPPPTTNTFGAAAVFGNLDCDDTTLDLTLTNNNNAAAGSRSFVVKLDGTSVATESLAAGASKTIHITIPDDAVSHTASVSSAGITLPSKSVAVTHCSTIVTNRPPTEVLGVQFTRAAPKATAVLGVKLARTGTDSMLMGLFAALMLMIGGAFEFAARRRNRLARDTR